MYDRWERENVSAKIELQVVIVLFMKFSGLE